MVDFKSLGKVSRFKILVFKIFRLSKNEDDHLVTSSTQKRTFRWIFSLIVCVSFVFWTFPSLFRLFNLWNLVFAIGNSKGPKENGIHKVWSILSSVVECLRLLTSVVVVVVVIFGRKRSVTWFFSSSDCPVLKVCCYEMRSVCGIFLDTWVEVDLVTFGYESNIDSWGSRMGYWEGHGEYRYPTGRRRARSHHSLLRIISIL